MTTKISLGTCSINARTACSVNTVPVGLFGVHNITMRGRLVIAANMASKSDSALAVSGADTSLPPAARMTIGEDSKDRHGTTRSCSARADTVPEQHGSRRVRAPD